jgi:hypothetical protein
MPRSRRTIALIIAATAAAACDRGRPEEELAQAREQERLEADPDGARVSIQAEDDDKANRPERIYYDLTAFDWYRQGQPMIVDGVEHVPAGEPQAERSRIFRKAGEYAGVDYYVPEDEDADPAVYVPVSPGYWQPFAPVRTQAQQAEP